VSASLGALIDALPRTTLVVGKGGVGKTTCAAMIAKHFAKRGERTLLISTDPAAALADVLGVAIATSAIAVSGHPNLDARQLDAAELRREFLDRWRDVLAQIVDRGTYLDREDVEGLVDAALPGADEIFALLALADLLADIHSPYARIVVDTAPTGHTLRLLALPDTFRALVAMLDAMQDKHRFMVRALTHRYKRDAADTFLDDIRRRIDGLRNALTNVEAFAAVLVTRAEPVVEAESRRYLENLNELHIRIAGVIVNAVAAAEKSHTLGDAIPHYRVALRTVLSPRKTNAKTNDASPVRLADLVRTITIVGGKGGVGKSTVSCALALAVANERGGRTLLVSTDPAPSLADALGESDTEWARSDVEYEISNTLTVRQLDASSAFARVRDDYQSRIDTVFDGLMGRGVDIAHDRAIIRDLLALAPPGIDELFALSLLGDTLAEEKFDRVIVDPAPTGHLLRLLDMPAIALDWTHRLMRLMLKYKDIVGLGDTANELLAFAKRTRALDALLHDATRAALVIVALDEPVVRAETERLARAAQDRAINLVAIVWNRVKQTPAPLPQSTAGAQFCAKEVSPPPIGITAIIEWSRSWRELA
jgi:arsenite-transporting ATPase